MPGVTTQIFIGLVIGIAIGHFWPAFGVSIKPLADAFLRMIKMIIAPLLFSTLVVGIAGTGDLKAMGRIGLKAIVYFEVATTIALVLGLALVNWFSRARAWPCPSAPTPANSPPSRRSSSTPGTSSCTSFPRRSSTRWRAATSCSWSSSRRFSASRSRPSASRGKPLVDVLESTAQVMFKFTGYVMRFAPIGVMAAIAATVGGKALGILFTLGKLVLLMYGGLFVFAIVVIGGVAWLIRVPFLSFANAIREPFLIAFTTASSEAALPKALEVMERFGVPKNIVGFVLPTGTASTSTARRSTCRWRACSWRSWPACR